MRRPLKPFVTEYKTSNRRTPVGLGEPASPPSDGPPAKLFDTRGKPESEDSYEAAMRAADALFSAPSNRLPPDAQRASPPSPPARDWRDADPVATVPPKNGGGRILRVLDEAPPPEYAALEAAHAPKRRGRKLGSKNKPKVAAVIAEAILADAGPDASLAEEAMPTHHPAPLQPARPTQAPAAHGASLPAKISRPKGDKRFAWVQDKLKPGEDWKRRRLPRVCW